MTKGAIAEHLGVTRLRVNRALQDAMRNGIVKVSIHSRFAPCLELEEFFREKFNLRHVAIAGRRCQRDQGGRRRTGAFL